MSTSKNPVQIWENRLIWSFGFMLTMALLSLFLGLIVGPFIGNAPEIIILIVGVFSFFVILTILATIISTLGWVIAILRQSK